MAPRISIASLALGVSSLSAAMVLRPTAAEALLVFNIYEQGADVVVQASGSILLPGQPDGFVDSCYINGVLFNPSANICTGFSGNPSNFYILRSDSPSSIEGNAMVQGANINTGIGVSMFGAAEGFLIDLAYQSGAPILSSSTYSNQTLAGFGFTSPLGTVLGTWFLSGSGDEIRVVLGSPTPSSTPSSVPGPLPLMGAAAAFTWSRKLRRRISANPFRF